MPDYLGPVQSRVLDAEERNFEYVVGQLRKPPLSNEWNLNGEIQIQRSQNIIRTNMPSGWFPVGSIKEDVTEDQCMAGDILISSSLSANTLKLIANDKGEVTQRNIAFVNGWPLLIQYSSSTDENNIITLTDPPVTGSRIDFVFLEVWKKLITPTDTIYRLGNVLNGTTNPSNDLIDPAINIETSLRIQIQYRLRVVEDIGFEAYPEGFDPTKVFAQGAASLPLCDYSYTYFNPVAGDIGLWRAGEGDAGSTPTQPSDSQVKFGTVDGYVYAVPMFAIHRRNTQAYNPDSNSNGALYSLAQYTDGTSSDRPDNNYNNLIRADDIIDLRHKVGLSGPDFKELSEKAFRMAMYGNLRTKMDKETLGGERWGTRLVQADAISFVDKAGSVRIGGVDGIRRVYSNATATQTMALVEKTVSDKTVGTPGNPWTNGDKVEIILDSVYPDGAVIDSVDTVYVDNSGFVTVGYSASGTGTNTVTVTLNSPPSVSNPIMISYTITYPSGPYGLSSSADEILEFRKEETTLAIASKDSSIRVRGIGPVSTIDGDQYNMLQNKGCNTTEPYDFGHQMVYHALGNATSIIEIPRTIDGYEILGIMSARVATGPGTYGSPETISVTRTASVYRITFTVSPVSGRDIEFVLYTKTKAFDTNKQGRAVTDCFEMVELTSAETGTGSKLDFWIDAGNRPIIAIGSYADEVAFAYVNDDQKPLATTNASLPDTSIPGAIQVVFPAGQAPAGGAQVTVPVLVKSAVTTTEGYTVFYKKTPYQGKLDAAATGEIKAVGPAIVTTAGSGGIEDYTYSAGTASFNTSSTTVSGTGTQWVSRAKIGYFIKLNSQPTKEFRITSIVDANTLEIADEPGFTGSGAYTIRADDTPSFNQRNIIDRFPTFNDVNDASAMNDNIQYATSENHIVLDQRKVSGTQDIEYLQPDEVSYGDSTADRGRSTISIDSAPLGVGTLGSSYLSVDSAPDYKKTYQSYLFNKNTDGTQGRLYLMVTGTENDNNGASCFFDENSLTDVVDIFELPGRPIIK